MENIFKNLVINYEKHICTLLSDLYIKGCMFSLEGMKYLTDEVNSVHPLMDSGTLSHV